MHVIAYPKHIELRQNLKKDKFSKLEASSLLCLYNHFSS